MSHQTVALDNITLHAEDTDINMLLVLGEAVNKAMEDRRDDFAKAYEDLLLFGYCEMVF